MTEQIPEIPQKQTESEVTPVCKKPVRHAKKFLLLVILLLFLILVVIFGQAWLSTFKKEQFWESLKFNDAIPSVPKPTETILTPTPDSTANWKTSAIGNVSFKYPPNWDNPETVSLSFGSGLNIKSSDNLYRLTFSTGISKGHNLEDLEKFINDIVSGGGEKISVGNNLASISKVEYQGVEIITAYIISPTKDQHYALSLSSRATGKEARNLFDQILSTFKFLD